MITVEYTDQLIASGLSKECAVVYELLLKTGESPASKLVKELPRDTTLSRPMMYKILDELQELELVEKKEKKGSVTTYVAKHPAALSKMLEKEKERIEYKKKQLQATTGKLSSMYNLLSGKPGVQFYEGEDGVWEVLMDSLTATEEILSYADLEAIDKYIPELNAEYSVMREENGVYKKGLIVDSPVARKFLQSYDKTTTSAKLIHGLDGVSIFQTVMQIYDQKVSYITLTDKYLMGIIITDQHIADTHKKLFEAMWNLTHGEVV